MEKFERSAFGQRLRDARELAGLTQTRAAELVGIKQPSLAELEKQGQGSALTPQLAQIYGCDPVWLATGEDPLPNVNAVTPEELSFLRDMRRLPRDWQASIVASVREVANRANETNEFAMKKLGLAKPAYFDAGAQRMAEAQLEDGIESDDRSQSPSPLQAASAQKRSSAGPGAS